MRTGFADRHAEILPPPKHLQEAPICKLCKHLAAGLIDTEYSHQPGACPMQQLCGHLEREQPFDVSVAYAVSLRGDLFLVPSSSAGRTRHLLLALKQAAVTLQMQSMHFPNLDHHLRSLSMSPLHHRSDSGAVLCGRSSK